MARRVFFSFYYEDVATFRANVVRKHDTLKETGTAGFFDGSVWEEARKKDRTALIRLINGGLENTSVTCALIGTNTWSRPWVRYELLKSYDRGNLLLGVHINSVKDKNQQTFAKGYNPFECLGLHIAADGRSRTYFTREPGSNWVEYSEFVPTAPNTDPQYWGKGYTLGNWVPCYDWVGDDGYNNFANWIETGAK